MVRAEFLPTGSFKIAGLYGLAPACYYAAVGTILWGGLPRSSSSDLGRHLPTDPDEQAAAESASYRYVPRATLGPLAMCVHQ